MKLDPPVLTEGPLSGSVFVVTHGKVAPHPTLPGQTMVTASVKYDVTEQFEALAARRRREVEDDCPAIERGARALWDLHRQGLPGKGEGMEPPWGDRESGQTARFYTQAESVLRAVGVAQ